MPECYFAGMGTARGNKVPDGAPRNQYDGFRMMVQRESDRVRLITRGGYDWADNYPWIVEAARKNRHKQFVIDGEAVLVASPAYPISTAALPQVRRGGAALRVQCAGAGPLNWRASVSLVSS